MTAMLITGGARSGKSLHAERLALAAPGRPVHIATAEMKSWALDAEMAERIALHQARRDERWLSHEAPLDLVGALAATDGGGARLIDCLTLWLSNLMHHDRDWRAEVGALAAALKLQTSPVILVTNEVGMGIVPENALARRYRDAAGIMNQIIAEAAEEVVFVVSGLPMRVK